MTPPFPTPRSAELEVGRPRTPCMSLTPPPLALLASLALAACSPSGETPAAHSAADSADGHTRSSSGIPAGNVAAGEKLATSKQAATGQACVDCHGAGGNAPIDPSYPKLGGQYRDYLSHSLQMYRDGERSHALMASPRSEEHTSELQSLM